MENKNKVQTKSGVDELYKKYSILLERVFGGKSQKERFLFVLGNVISALIAVVFTNAPLPLVDSSIGAILADAFLCASSTFSVGAYIGAMYGTHLYFELQFTRYLLLTTVFVLRIAACLWLSDGEKGHKLFLESKLMKVGTAAVYSLILCGMTVATLGFSYEILNSIIVLLVATPLICFVFCEFFEGYPTKEIGSYNLAGTLLYDLCLSLFFAAIVYSTHPFTFAGCSLSGLSAVFLTLLVCLKGGAVRGGMVGFLLGWIYSPIYAAPLAVMGVLSGLLLFTGVSAAAIIGVTVASIYAIYNGKITAVNSFVPEAVIALAVTIPIIRYDFLYAKFPYPKDGEDVDSALTARSDIEYKMNETLSMFELADAFSELGESFCVISRTENNDALYEMDEICDKVCHGICETCPLNPICWDSELALVTNSVRQLIWQYRKAPNADVKTPDYLLGHCVKLKELKGEIKTLCQSFPNTKEMPKIETVGQEFKAVGEMLASLARKSRLESEQDKTLAAKVAKAAKNLAFSAEAITVVGNRHKKIFAYGVKKESVAASSEKLRELFSQTLKCNFSTPVFVDCEGGKMVSVAKEKFVAHGSFLSFTKDGEECSGDIASTFVTDDGYYYAMLSDGMGSGKEAANCSQICALLLEKMLKCHVQKNLAIRLIGDILRRRDSECFVTVDLAEIDLFSGKAEFVKNGATASYVLREGSVYCVNAYSMPIGITKESPSEEMTFPLKDGDVIVMVSDGVASDISDGTWMIDLISLQSGENADDLVKKILAKARTLRKKSDDMTALVVKIASNE